MKKSLYLLFLFSTLTSFVLGTLMGQYYPQIRSRLRSTINRWDNTERMVWPDAFSEVRIPSSADGTKQHAYFLKAVSGLPKPLVVSLHSWSGDYSQNDALANLAAGEGWNYIHPDFRGPNWIADSCLSDRVISDIDDAIQYAIDNGNVDLSNVFVVGASGGGYATLGAYLKTRHQVKAFLSWVPISDLVAWYLSLIHI